MSRPVLFPFFTDIRGKTFLIVGGGAVAAGKAERLRQFTDRIILIAPKTEVSGVQVIRRAFAPGDLERADYVVAATDDHEMNRQIARLCRGRNLPVNVADDPKLCTFFFPAVIRRGPLTVGITTTGASPAYAQLLRRSIEDELPEKLETVLDRMQLLREYLPEITADQRRRRTILREALFRLLAQEEPERLSLEELAEGTAPKNEQKDQKTGKEE